MEMEISAIMELVQSYVALFLPAITYAITGIVALVKLIKQFKSLKSEVDTKVDETKENVEDVKDELIDVKNELILSHQQNDELRRDMKKLMARIDKIEMEE